MQLLLPPSEAKNPGGRGRPIRARSLSDNALAEARDTVITALLKLVRDAPERAARALLLPGGVAAEALAANAAVLDSPTMPALRRYSGVVYDGLDLASLSPPEQRLAVRSTYIFSGLFGVLRGDEPVPAYRVPAKAVLPGVGVAATYWRPVLSRLLPDVLARGLVVDLRSSDYAAMWRPGRDFAERVVGVRVLSPAPRGGHAVISYNSKRAKGRLAAELIRRSAAGARVESAQDVVAAWLECGGGHADVTGAGLDLYEQAAP